MNLNRDIVVKIFRLLDPVDVLRAGRVCRLFWEMSHSPLVWRYVFHVCRIDPVPGTSRFEIWMKRKIQQECQLQLSCGGCSTQIYAIHEYGNGLVPSFSFDEFYRLDEDLVFIVGLNGLAETPHVPRQVIRGMSRDLLEASCGFLLKCDNNLEGYKLNTSWTSLSLYDANYSDYRISCDVDEFEKHDNFGYSAGRRKKDHGHDLSGGVLEEEEGAFCPSCKEYVGFSDDRFTFLHERKVKWNLLGVPELAFVIFRELHRDFQRSEPQDDYETRINRYSPRWRESDTGSFAEPTYDDDEDDY